MPVVVAGSAAATPYQPAAYPGRPVATHGFSGAAAGLSNGTFTGSNARMRHRAVANIGIGRLVYRNAYNDSAGSDPITVRATVEVLSGHYTAVQFGGVRDVVIPAGGYAISDPVAIDVAAGATFYSRTFVSVTAGAKWPKYHYANALGSWGEGVSASNGETDLTTSGSITGGTEYGFYPYMIVSQESAALTVPCIALIGDSIMVGANAGDNSFAMRALNDTFAFVKIPKVGEQIQTFAQRDQQPVRKSLLANCTTALCNYGINDLRSGGGGRTFTQYAADVLTLATLMTNRGMRYFQTTVTPNPTSTDAFATVANQTADTNDAQRVAANQWLRAGAPVDPVTKAQVAVGTSGALLAGSNGHPIYAVFDTASTVEAGTDTGKWDVTKMATSDGLHPDAAGHGLMAAVVNTALFV